MFHNNQTIFLYFYIETLNSILHKKKQFDNAINLQILQKEELQNVAKMARKRIIILGL